MTDKVSKRFQSASRGIIAASEPVREQTPIAAAPGVGASANFNRIRFGLVTVAFVRFEDIHFEFGSSFLLPFDFDAGPIKRLFEKHTASKFSVFGHADPAGRETFNKVLSGRRAAVVYGLLIRDVDLWHQLYTDHDTNGKDEWGVRSVQVMLKRVGNNPGPPDGVLGAQTRSALRTFQEANGLSLTPFDNRGHVDSLTFKVLARAYMDSICVDRSSRRFRPTGGDLRPEQFVLKKTDFIAEGRGKDLKGDVQGCGEFNALIRLSKSEEEAFAQDEDKTERNRENQPNRRVLLLLFRPNTLVDPVQWPCPTFKEGIAGCQERFFSDAPRRAANADERRFFQTTKDTFECRFFQRLHENALFQIVTTARLDSRFALTQFEGVAKLFTREEFHSWMLVLFGADIPEETLDQVHQQLREGTFPNCDIELVAGGVEGHKGAYDRVDKMILVDEELALRAEKDNNTAMELASILIEEYGHFIDDHIRTEMTNIGGDADLDEGSLFGFALVNLKQDLQGEIEYAQHTHDGITVPLDMNYEQLKDQTRVFFSEEDQLDDARTERFEFFGAGPGEHRSGQQPGSSFGHESIEFTLESVGFNKDNDPVKSELKRIYFGNWLRDFSQLVDPAITRAASSPATTDGFTRASLTSVLDIISREHFGNDPIFEVTEARCLVYRPDHHIDNPKGLEDGRPKDPLFRHAFNPVEGEIDPALGMKKYIRSPGLPRGSGFSTAAEFMVSELDAAMVEGRTTEGFRRLGGALHTLEDYYSHSNFVELSLIELGHTNVFPWAGTPIVSSDPTLNGKFPIVTGMFGKSDTLVSVLDVVGEHLQNLKPCEAGARSTGAKILLILLRDKGKSELARKIEFILNKIEDIKKEFPQLATLMCRMAEAALRWLKALIGAAIVQIMDLVSVAQKDFENNPKSTDPTHSMLAKDHDVHPLHVIAANLAAAASKDVADAMNKFWLNSPGENPRVVALEYLVHPAVLNARSNGKGAPLTGGRQRMWDKMKSAAGDPANQGKIKKVEGSGWMHEQLERAKKEQEEIRKRAKQFDLKKTEEEIEETIRRIEELRRPPLPVG